MTNLHQKNPQKTTKNYGLLIAACGYNSKHIIVKLYFLSE